jgi:hypothetical protein
MKALLRLELERALHCRAFIASVAVGSLLSIIAATECIWRYYYSHEWGDLYLQTSFLNQYSFNAYTQWLPNAVMQATPALFFFIAPLLIGLSYGWSWCGDIAGGYAASVIARAPRKTWELAKALAAFVSGGLVVSIPLLINFVLVFCSVPAQVPSVTDMIWNGILDEEFLSELFYSNPPACVAFRFVFDFVLSGLWATAVIGLSRLFRNRVAVVVLPYIGMLVVKYVSQSVAALVQQGTGFLFGTVTLIDLLRVRGDYTYYTWAGIAFFLASTLILSIVFPRAARRRDVL